MQASTIEAAEPMQASQADRRHDAPRAYLLTVGALLAVLLVVVLAAWELFVRWNDVPSYLLPGAAAGRCRRCGRSGTRAAGCRCSSPSSSPLSALLLAIVGGVALGTLFALSRYVEVSLFPFAVVLQVTPIIAIAPLIMIYVDSTMGALLICAWIVAFFPILSSTVIGLRSADHNLRDLFSLYRASPWQRFRLLQTPSALPYFMSGLKVSGGLALIGAVVAEFVAGAAGKETGLASRIFEASFRSDVPLMFAALFLVSACGILIFLVTSWISHKVLGHWHESELKRER